MPKFFDKNKSLTFLCLYLKTGEKKYYSSRLKEDKISKETGMKGLRKRFVNGRYQGKYHTAIIYDNNSKEPIQQFDEYGKRIYKNGWL